MYKIQKYLNIPLSTATYSYFLILIVLPGVWSHLIVQSLKLILGTKGTLHSLFLTLKGKEARWRRARDTFEYLFQVFHF